MKTINKAYLCSWLLLHSLVCYSSDALQDTLQTQEQKAIGGKVKHVETIEEFDNLIAEHNVVVDFYASWCGPCKVMAPIFDAIAKEFDSVVFIKINVDEWPEISSRYQIQSVPTLLFFNKNTKACQKLNRVVSKTDLRKIVKDCFKI